MSVKVQLRDVIEGTGSLEKLLDMDGIFKGKANYAASKLLRKARSAIKDFQDADRRLIKSLGEMDKERQVFRVKSENMDEYNRQTNETLDGEVELEGALPVKWSDIQKHVEDGKIKPTILAGVIPFIDGVPEDY